MTSQKQAVDQLGKLYSEYCPLLDQLMAATRDHVASLVAEEQNKAKRIWELGVIAFGARGRTLEMLKPDDDEIKEISNVQPLNEEHRVALIGCCVRSKRLRKMLEERKPERAPDVMLRAAAKFWERDDELGRPLERGEAAHLYEAVGKEIGCPANTVKLAVKKHPKVTVTK